MWATCSFYLLILSFIILPIHAIPIGIWEPLKVSINQKRATYSIVPVDGNSGFTSTTTKTPQIETTTQTFDRIKTITIPLTVLPGSTRKVVSTKSMTQPTPTITIPKSSEITTIITETVTPIQRTTLYPVSAEPPNVTPSVSYSIVNPKGTTLISKEISASTASLSFTAPISTGERNCSENGSVTTISKLPGQPIQSSRPTHLILSSEPLSITDSYDNGLWHTNYYPSNATSLPIHTSSSATPIIGMAAPTSNIITP